MTSTTEFERLGKAYTAAQMEVALMPGHATNARRKAAKAKLAVAEKAWYAARAEMEATV